MLWIKFPLVIVKLQEKKTMSTIYITRVSFKGTVSSNPIYQEMEWFTRARLGRVALDSDPHEALANLHFL